MTTKYSMSAILACAAMMTALALAPIAAHADSRQKNKNLWRNGAIAGGAVALYGLHNHDTATTVAGVAGAAYAGNRYEQDRRSQAAQRRARARYHRYHRYHHRHLRHG